MAATGSSRLAGAERDAIRRSLAKAERQPEWLRRAFLQAEDDESVPWDLVRREIAQAEREKQQRVKALVKVERLIDQQRRAAEQHQVFNTYGADVAANLAELGFLKRRSTVEAPDGCVTVAGRHWRIDGGVPFES